MRLLAAAVVCCAAATATVSAKQPILAPQPIQVRGDTLDHVDSWDVRYGALPDLRLAALPPLSGPARATRGSTTSEVSVVAAPRAAPKIAPTNRAEGSPAEDSDFAKGLTVPEASLAGRGVRFPQRTVDDSVSPAEYYQPPGSEPMPRPSYLEPESENQPEAQPPAYLDTGNVKLTIEEELEGLKQRIGELETARVAQEDATRTIIRRTFAERGSNINDFVVFGGTLETLTFWQEDFDGVTGSDIILDTAELDFEIQVNPWTLGSLVFEYFDGSDFTFPTTEEDEVFVDRVNLRQAWISIGDTANYPLFATFGRDVIPFGISTGDPVADVLTINDPLTVEVFETTEDFILIGFVGPVCCPPPLAPNAPPGPPPVRGILINPLVRRASTCLCSYCPCTPPPVPAPPPPIVPTCLPPYSGAIYFYNGDTIDEGYDHIEHMGGTLGYQTRGVLPYRCLPWTLDCDVDVNSSVFDSDFLQFEYRRFLNQIGYVPGMAAHVKGSLGPTAYVVEWNGALMDAEFDDDDGTPISIRPRAWQISFAYQFGWNRSVEIIGAQGTYFTIGYSESQDLAGVTRVIGTAPDPVTAFRVGNVPEKRLSVGMGEWVLDGLRVALEYSHAIDYSDGLGTGNSADGVFMQMTYEW